MSCVPVERRGATAIHVRNRGMQHVGLISLPLRCLIGDRFGRDTFQGNGSTAVLQNRRLFADRRTVGHLCGTRGTFMGHVNWRSPYSLSLCPFSTDHHAYACNPGSRYVTPKKVNITTTKPRIAKYAARRPLQPRVMRMCR
jgi:hypothetical protein